MLKVVLDTNVYVSALINPAGVPGQILLSFLENKSFQLILSKEILNELKLTLNYSKVKKYLKYSKKEIESWLVALSLKADFVETISKIDIIETDPDDNIYLEAAVDSNSTFIVTGDDHLLKQKNYQGIQIIPPKDFIKIIAFLGKTSR